MSGSNRQRIILNVRGVIFETYTQTLQRFPFTLLGNTRSRSVYYCCQTKQHFFNCNQTCFANILHFYQTNGSLRCPMGISVTLFEQECNYFKLPRDIINSMKNAEGILLEVTGIKRVFDDRRRRGLQVRVWDFLEHPNTSLPAWGYGIISLSIVWLSIIVCCLEDMPYFQSLSKIWNTSELVIHIWFLTELLLRMVFSGNKLEFLTSFMNVVDITALIPFFSIKMIGTGKNNLISILQTLKFLRVFRLFRLTKHSKRLRLVATILQSSLSNFRVLMVCLMMSIFLGGSIMYIIENDGPHSVFQSIPVSLWWACITITSVGYGDIYPESTIGKVFAGGYMLFAAMTISLPILSVVVQFIDLYPKNIDSEYYTTSKQICDEEKKPIRKRSKVIGVN